jgi:hypothetical protein
MNFPRFWESQFHHQKSIPESWGNSLEIPQMPGNQICQGIDSPDVGESIPPMLGNPIFSIKKLIPEMLGNRFPRVGEIPGRFPRVGEIPQRFPRFWESPPILLPKIMTISTPNLAKNNHIHTTDKPHYSIVELSCSINCLCLSDFKCR